MRGPCPASLAEARRLRRRSGGGVDPLVGFPMLRDPTGGTLAGDDVRPLVQIPANIDSHGQTRTSIEKWQDQH